MILLICHRNGRDSGHWIYSTNVDWILVEVSSTIAMPVNILPSGYRIKSELIWAKTHNGPVFIVKLSRLHRESSTEDPNHAGDLGLHQYGNFPWIESILTSEIAFMTGPGNLDKG
jgi:hypothetical protein